MNEDHEFVVRALDRAQRVAQRRGYRRTGLPSGLFRQKNQRNETGSSETSAMNASDLHSDTSLSDTADPAEALSLRTLRHTTSPLPCEEESLRLLARQGDEDGDLVSIDQPARLAGAKWVRNPGMAAQRTRYRPVDSLEKALKRVIQTNGWEKPVGMGTVMGRWTQIVGPDVARHCYVETFDEGVLVVRTSSTAWMKQMQLLLPTVERRIAEEVGPGIVAQVIVRGPAQRSWKKGLWSVPGRGPRDTYG